MKSRNLTIATAAAVVFAIALFSTVAYGMYLGISQGSHRAPAAAPGAIVRGNVPAALGTTDSAPAIGAANPASGAANSASAIAQPAPGAFYPGMLPFGTGGAAADGISTWGVAYRQGSDPAAQPDAALVKAAYQDAEKGASDLAAATGVKLGKLVAMTDYTNNQPYFKPCIYSGGPAEGKPVPQASAGTGASGAGAPTTTIAPVPVPCPASSANYYLVVWVYVRHSIS